MRGLLAVARRPARVELFSVPVIRSGIRSNLRGGGGPCRSAPRSPRAKGRAVTSLLVVAGEASGDRAAAAVLGKLPGVKAFGLGGASLERAGADVVCDLRESTALGVGEVSLRAFGVLRSWRRVMREVAERKPRAALLVNYTEYNSRLAPRLQEEGVRVLWYGAPQVWAWRAGRTTTLRTCVDRLAVMLPFEASVWAAAGVDAHYVGHPALESSFPRDPTPAPSWG